MADLPELPPAGQMYMQIQKKMTRAKIDRARIHLKYMSRAKTRPTHERHLENARACVQTATDELFDAYAAQYWQVNRYDSALFADRLLAIRQAVERDISCPRLAEVIIVLTSDKIIDWADRSVFEAAVADPALWEGFHSDFAALVNDERMILKGA